ncbi:MAG TPA: sulfur carrier protein ThiS [Ideonella sp.]|uniref:sulfur carrier protein ThiS n=1 Tax=Ideonella sp. TaxID=1929293 RepID=UPI002E2FCBBA|nr:sulfur carrier protein ThiS [Ideonella sp.]HEX5684295.1 sulfur carrier protein ThiS [Ideonella sp.]
MTKSLSTNVIVNGEPVVDGEGLSLAELLIRLGEPADQVATALNGNFVARDSRDDIQLAGGDRITVFKAIVGG